MLRAKHLLAILEQTETEIMTDGSFQMLEGNQVRAPIAETLRLKFNELVEEQDVAAIQAVPTGAKRARIARRRPS